MDKKKVEFKKIVSYSILSFFLLIIFSHSILLFCGYKMYVVKSGSMEPDLPVGSLIYVKKYKNDLYSHIEVGDDITFYLNTYPSEDMTICTHRIIEINQEEDKIITKSIIEDSIEDKPITSNDVIGKVMFHINGIGYLYSIFTNLYFWLIIIFGLIILILIYKIIQIKKKEQ